MGVRYKKKKLFVFFRKLFRKRTPKMAEVQKKAYDIAIKLINDSQSELMVAPITNKKYIKNGDIFVTIERGNLNIINGVYHYDVYINDKLYEYISNKINTKLDRRITKFETEIKERVTDRLTEILTDIEKKRPD